MLKNETTEQSKESSNEKHEVSFKYVKSNFFRVIHADGAWGGLSPKGDIHIAFYNERAAIPDHSSFTISGDGTIATPEHFEAESDLVREVEFDVIVDLTTAKSLRTWLDSRIRDLEERIREAKTEQAKHAGQEAQSNGK